MILHASALDAIAISGCQQMNLHNFGKAPRRKLFVVFIQEVIREIVMPQDYCLESWPFPKDIDNIEEDRSK